jgi:NAD(P)-dependent dehydrogenase (short-subunit alcohol dehydrogenase family)
MNTIDLFSLKGKVAIITGAAGLLGLSFAQALSDAGASIALCDLDYNKCIEKSKEITTTKIITVKVDVTNKESVFSMVEEVQSEFKRIDILVNGAYRHISTSFEDRRLEDFEEILRVNLTGVFQCCQALTPVMKEQGGGVMINIGSIYGVVSADPRIYGNSDLNSPEVYAASKGGVIHLTRYLAVHLAKYNIRVNCISPGGVFNNQPEDFLTKYAMNTPLGRMARADELKGALVFLASDASSYVTGHNLMVDGGFTIW